ncbi:MAG: hypothetical protein U1E27_05945, partial [Kiritimatiellia bacterium]|nr:hypothetical protein [Kiritimatiellia bacterium]
IHGREALEKALRDYKGAVCFVSHDLAFVRGVADHIIAIGPQGVVRYSGGYDYYLEKTGGIHESLKPEPESGAVAEVVPAVRGRDLRIARLKEREAQKALRQMEIDMERLHGEQRELCARMEAGDPQTDYGDLSRQLAEITRKLTTLESRWLEEADRINA